MPRKFFFKRKRYPIPLRAKQHKLRKDDGGLPAICDEDINPKGKGRKDKEEEEEEEEEEEVVEEEEFLPSSTPSDEEEEQYDEESDAKEDGSDEDEEGEEVDITGDRKRIKERLSDAGLAVHCDVVLNVKEAADCSKTQTLMSRVAAFLQWTHERVKRTALDPEAALQWFSVFVGGNSSSNLQEYCKYLLTEKGFTPGTIANTLGDLSTAAQWLCLFSPFAKYFCEKQSEIAAFNLVSVLSLVLVLVSFFSLF
jgi:hypothetical protein